MKVSYLKYSWLNLLFGLADLVVAIYNFCVGDELWGIGWTLAAVLWFVMSFINYNDERIKVLEKEKERNDALVGLVHELVRANKIDREIMQKYEARLKKLEDRK
jgi:hypothetical protein